MHKIDIHKIDSRNPKLKHTVYLDIEDHYSNWCDHESTGLDIPNLSILKIRLNKNNGLHIDPNFSSSQNTSHRENRPCRLLLDIQPRVLIIDNYQASSREDLLRPNILPDMIWENIKTLVLITPSSTNLSQNWTLWSNDFSNQFNRMLNLMQVYWMVDPLPPVKDIKKPTRKSQVENTVRISNEFWYDCYSSLIAPIFNSSPNVKITYVNSGSTYLSLTKDEQVLFRNKQHITVVNGDEGFSTSNINTGNIIKKKSRYKMNVSEMIKPYQIESQNIIMSESDRVTKNSTLSEEQKDKRKQTIQFLSLDEWMNNDVENSMNWLGKDELIKWKEFMKK